MDTPLTVEELLPVSWRSRPRSFVALMSVYESNFRRLLRLTGNPRALPMGERRAAVEGDCDLILRVTHRSVYTTMIELTYQFDGAGEAVILLPDMQVRVYHDARLAGAHAWAQTHQHPRLRGWRRALDQDLDERWARNVVLNKWLEYCLERGYRF
jgi:uncharacterized protein YqiB (DUF1249 family)